MKMSFRLLFVISAGLAACGDPGGVVDDDDDVADDDAPPDAPPPEPAIVVTADDPLESHEAGPAITFTIALTTAPTADVELGLHSTEPAEGTAEVERIAFTPEDWGPRDIAIRSIDDVQADGDAWFQIEFDAAISDDTRFAGQQPEALSVRSIDDGERRQFPVQVEVDGDGRIRSDDGRIDCPGACAADYDEGARVVLSAEPVNGARFLGWYPSGHLDEILITVNPNSESWTWRAVFGPAWIESARPLDGAGDESLGALAYDPTSGALVLGGWFWGTTTFAGPELGATGGAGDSDVLVAKLDAATLAPMWRQTFTGPRRGEAHAIVVLDDGDVVVTGWYLGELTVGDVTLPDPGSEHATRAFVARLAGDDGAVRWARTFDPTWSGGSALAVDDDGAIYLCGAGLEGAVTRLDGDGEVVWSSDSDARGCALISIDGDHIVFANMWMEVASVARATGAEEWIGHYGFTDFAYPDAVVAAGGEAFLLWRDRGDGPSAYLTKFHDGEMTRTVEVSFWVEPYERGGDMVQSGPDELLLAIVDDGAPFRLERWSMSSLTQIAERPLGASFDDAGLSLNRLRLVPTPTTPLLAGTAYGDVKINGIRVQLAEVGMFVAELRPSVFGP